MASSKKDGDAEPVKATKTSSLTPSWHSAIAGACAGLGSRTATAPLDLLRIRRQLGSASKTGESPFSLVQTWYQIVQTERGGLMALYRGNTAAMGLWVGYSTVQFAVYDRCRELVRIYASNDTVVAFVAGALAGTAATLATYPFDLCRTTFAARGIVQDEGVAITKAPRTRKRKAQVKTLQFSSNLSLAEPPAPFSTNEPMAPRQPTATTSSTTKSFASKNPKTGKFIVPPLQSNLSLAEPPLPFSLDGPDQPKSPAAPPASSSAPKSSATKRVLPAIPKAAAATASEASGATPPKTISEFAMHLYHRRGITGFYAGSGPAVLQIIPYMGLTFALYDYLQNNQSIISSAYAGSVAGGISKLIVYPLDTGKRRLQGQAFYGTGTDKNIKPYTGLVDCWTRMIREEGGVASLYRGVVPSVLKTTIATSLSFAIYKGVMQVLEKTV